MLLRTLKPLKHEWLSNTISCAVALVLIVTGYFAHHALLLLVLFDGTRNQKAEKTA